MESRAEQNNAKRKEAKNAGRIHAHSLECCPVFHCTGGEPTPLHMWQREGDATAALSELQDLAIQIPYVFAHQAVPKLTLVRRDQGEETLPDFL